MGSTSWSIIPKISTDYNRPSLFLSFRFYQKLSLLFIVLLDVFDIARLFGLGGGCHGH